MGLRGRLRPAQEQIARAQLHFAQEDEGYLSLVEGLEQGRAGDPLAQDGVANGLAVEPRAAAPGGAR